MSPTIPPVLVLSLLLVPIIGARDTMDPFTVIRRTLKYWLRIYQMYQEEVDLGYCWADYFLYREKNTMNETMSQPVSVNPSNFLSIDEDGFAHGVKEDASYVTLTMDTDRSYARSKRSYEISDTRSEGILEILRKVVENSEKFLIPDVYSGTVERLEAKSIKSRNFENSQDNDSIIYRGFLGNRMQDWVVLANSDEEYRGSKSFYGISNYTEEDEILEVLKKIVKNSVEKRGFIKKTRNSKYESLVNVHSVKSGFPSKHSYGTTYTAKEIIEEIVKIFEKIVRSNDWRDAVKQSVVSDVHSKTTTIGSESKERNPNFEKGKNDFAKYKGSLGNLRRNGPRHDRRKRCSGISKSGDGDVHGISKIFENSSVQESTTSNMLSKTGQIKFKSNKLTSNFKSTDIAAVRNEEGETFSKDTRADRFILTNERPFEISNFTEEKEEEEEEEVRHIAESTEKLIVEKSTSDIRAETVKVKLLSNEGRIGDPRSIECQRRKDPWSFVVDSVLESSLLVPSSSTEEQQVNHEDRLSPRKIDAESQGIRAEDASGEKSKMLQMGTNRKLLYPEKNRVTSGRSSRYELSGSSLYSGRTISSLNSRFKDSKASKELEDNREPSDFHPRRMNFGSSNLEFQRVEQRPGSFRGNYRRNLRRKRDANDRIRSRSVKPLSKSGRGSSYNPTSTDDIPRFSSRYRSRFDGVWSSNGIGSRSINSGNDERVLEQNVRRSFASGIVHSGGHPIYYLERYRDTPSINRRTTIRASPIALEEIHNVPSHLIDLEPHMHRRASSSHVLVKNPLQDSNDERKNDREDGSSSKQLPNANDYRYRKTEKHNFLEKPTTERTAGKKLAIQYLMGQPSLLPISYPRFMKDYGGSTNRTAWDTRTSRLSMSKDQGRRSSMTKVEARTLGRTFATLLDLRQAVMGFLRTLGFFVQVGRQLMDYVDSNSALTCTKDYLMGKVIQWIDS